MNLIDCVAEHATKRPNSLAVIQVRGSTAAAWSWRKLWRESERIASLLLEFRVRPGEVVGYQLPNCAEFVAITLAVLRIGAICCPLMPILSEREIAFALERSRARVLFAMGAAGKGHPIDEIATLVHRLHDLEHLIVIGARDRIRMLPETQRLTSCWLDERLATIRLDAHALDARSVLSGALAQLLFTPGTSEAPKGILHRHDALMNATELAAQQLGLTHRDVHFVLSPLAEQSGFLYGMWLAMRLGAAHVLQSLWEPRHALATMREWGVTVVKATTPLLGDLAQALEAGDTPPTSLRCLVANGTSVRFTLARRATELFRAAVCGAFGTTESCLATLCSPDDAPEKTWGSEGRALPSVEIRVCDQTGDPLPPCKEGELQVRSPTMFEGYLDDPKQTTEVYTPDGWYRTRDLAVIDAEGFLHVTQRPREAVKRAGEIIPVAPIERAQVH